jgi:hypothetical protein
MASAIQSQLKMTGEPEGGALKPSYRGPRSTVVAKQEALIDAAKKWRESMEFEEHERWKEGEEGERVCS